jgi:hypothetical protein
MNVLLDLEVLLLRKNVFTRFNRGFPAEVPNGAFDSTDDERYADAS